MRNAAITLVVAMAAGTLMPAVWETLPQQGSPEAALAAPTPAQTKSSPQWEYVPLPENLARGTGAIQGSIPPLSLT